jgi:hypothetical protein
MDLSRFSPLFDLINAELALGISKDDTHPIRSEKRSYGIKNPHPDIPLVLPF